MKKDNGGLTPAAQSNLNGLKFTALRAARARSVAAAALLDEGRAALAFRQVLIVAALLDGALPGCLERIEREAETAEKDATGGFPAVN